MKMCLRFQKFCSQVKSCFSFDIGKIYNIAAVFTSNTIDHMVEKDFDHWQVTMSTSNVQWGFTRPCKLHWVTTFFKKTFGKVNSSITSSDMQRGFQQVIRGYVDDGSTLEQHLNTVVVWRQFSNQMKCCFFHRASFQIYICSKAQKSLHDFMFVVDNSQVKTCETFLCSCINLAAFSNDCLDHF